MVQYEEIDTTFAALADPTRRAILERLGRGPAIITALAGLSGMSLTGLAKHVRVLEDAGLVVTRKDGRTRTCRLGHNALDVEHSHRTPTAAGTFEGRFREIVDQQRIVWTFEWDGMPGYVSVDTMVFDELPDGRTRLTIDALFHTAQERDGMVGSGMEGGMNTSYRALDALLAETAG